MITHRATLDVSRELACQVSQLLHAERRRRGTRKHSRALSCFRHAVLGVRWFRQHADITALARDHGISRATGYRYVEEVVTVLAAQAPDLHEALERAKAAGMAFVILDGKIFSADLSRRRTGSRCGSPTWNLARSTTSPPRESACSARCSGPRHISICRLWPMAATTVPGSACIRRSNSPPTASCLR
jgi:hypothetical protein